MWVNLGNFGQFMATFLVVVLCAWRLIAHMESESMGLDVLLGHDCRKLFPGEIMDGRPIVIQLHADGTVWVNEDAVADKDVVSLVNHILSTRQEKVVSVMAEEAVPYSRFVTMADRLAQGSYESYINILIHRDLGPGRFDEQSCFAPTP